MTEDFTEAAPALDMDVDQTSAPVPASTSAPAPLAAAEDLDGWFRRHVPNSPVARNTEAHNRIFNAMVEIKSALASVKE